MLTEAAQDVCPWIWWSFDADWNRVYKVVTTIF